MYHPPHQSGVRRKAPDGQQSTVLAKSGSMMLCEGGFAESTWFCIHKHLRVFLGFEGLGFKVRGQQAAVYAGFMLDPLAYSTRQLMFINIGTLEGNVCKTCIIPFKGLPQGLQNTPYVICCTTSSASEALDVLMEAIEKSGHSAKAVQSAVLVPSVVSCFFCSIEKWLVLLPFLQRTHFVSGAYWIRSTLFFVGVPNFKCQEELHSGIVLNHPRSPSGCNSHCGEGLHV